ncbi:MAG TPA: hypothetical protein VNJ02_19530 [Vicinamibacterales bacterium]|nr:hypothetical protein [Vicinamibacterales bacterium]
MPRLISVTVAEMTAAIGSSAAPAMSDAGFDAETTQLVIRARTGDRDAFSALIDLHHRAALRVAAIALGNHADAEGTPARKVVSMMVADDTLGRIRSVGGPMLSFLNVDARPQVLDSGDRILLELTVEYKPEQADGGPTNVMRTAVNESLSIILQSGKPLVVSQAADPVADRKMTVEVKATIIR